MNEPFFLSLFVPHFHFSLPPFVQINKVSQPLFHLGVPVECLEISNTCLRALDPLAQRLLALTLKSYYLELPFVEAVVGYDVRVLEGDNF
jgi:hypothetical protein